jgi:hypothetical protein
MSVSGIISDGIELPGIRKEGDIEENVSSVSVSQRIRQQKDSGVKCQNMMTQVMKIVLPVFLLGGILFLLTNYSLGKLENYLDKKIDGIEQGVYAHIDSVADNVQKNMGKVKDGVEGKLGNMTTEVEFYIGELSELTRSEIAAEKAEIKEMWAASELRIITSMERMYNNTMQKLLISSNQEGIYSSPENSNLDLPSLEN